MFTTTVNMAEMLYGIALLPAGKRRTSLQFAAEEVFEENFAGRVLPFDSDAARFFAEIAAARRATGRPIGQFDAQIAAIARSHGATVATAISRISRIAGSEWSTRGPARRNKKAARDGRRPVISPDCERHERWA
jgi:predicted nucleic acid-binding protein